MSTERVIRLLAGTMILASVALTVFVSRYWLFLTVFVGLNLFQSGITRWCFAETVLHSMGLRSQGAEGRSCRC